MIVRVTILADDGETVLDELTANAQCQFEREFTRNYEPRSATYKLAGWKWEPILRPIKPVDLTP